MSAPTDKDRLDFVQANHTWLTRSRDHIGTSHEWRVSLGMGALTFDGRTAREALDAAMVRHWVVFGTKGTTEPSETVLPPSVADASAEAQTEARTRQPRRTNPHD